MGVSNGCYGCLRKVSKLLIRVGVSYRRVNGWYGFLIKVRKWLMWVHQKDEKGVATLYVCLNRSANGWWCLRKVSNLFIYMYGHKSVLSTS